MKYQYRKDYYYKGKRVQAYGNTLKAFTDCMKRKEAKIDEALIMGTGKRKFRGYCEECYDLYKPNLSDDARKCLMSVAKHHVFPHIGMLSLNVITPKHIQEMLNRLKGYSSTMPKIALRICRFTFTHAVLDGLIMRDPSLYAEMPETVDGERRALEPWEREAILKTAVTDRAWYGYLLMMLCGCRPSEAYNALGSDIMEVDGVPTLHIRGTKTSLSDRFVPMPKGLYQIIRKTPLNENVTFSRCGKRLTTKGGIVNWKGFVRQVNIDLGCKTYKRRVIDPVFGKDLVPYCLRHEYCTDLARRGIDIRIAQRLMGHSNINTTVNIYTNFKRTEIIGQAKELAELEVV